MKISSGRRKGKLTWFLLVLAFTGQTTVSCTRNSESTTQALVAEQEKRSETESVPEEEPVTEVQESDWKKYGTDVADVDKSIEIEYADGDCERSVTRDVRFVNQASAEMDTDWVSSDKFVVTDEGRVIRQKEDKNVTITANIRYMGKNYRKKFSLIVKRKNTIDTDSLEDYSLDQIKARHSCDVEVDESGYIRQIDGKYSDIKADSYDMAFASLYNIKSAMGIGNPSEELQVKRVDTVGTGYIFKFSQMYKGLEVLGCGVTVAANQEGDIYYLSSSCVQISGDTDIRPQIARKEAVEKAKQAGCGEEDWGNEKPESRKLYIYNENGKGRLVWFMYFVNKQDDSVVVLVDAKTGEVVDQINVTFDF